jgi:NAD(P)-dependent dehydrogenase (short-subunit alcohol dehydrogenase family)
VITGAARGIGRAHVDALVRAGARVVVNDIGVSKDGSQDAVDAAGRAVEEIRERGGIAVAHTGDVSTAEGAESLVQLALSTWGRLDVVVNNAGILRDRTIVNMSESDWDAVMNVHLRSTFLTTRAAAQHWRELAKSGAVPDARIVNTTSSSGLYGNVGQANYGAAKAGVASFTIIAAMELARYGVTVNALCPTARTRMTEDTRFGQSDDARNGVLEPQWVSPALVWLASPLSSDVTGRVVVASGRGLGIAEGWHLGPRGSAVAEDHEVDAVIRPLLAVAADNANMRGETGVRNG